MNEDFATEFANADLKDERRSRRLEKVASALADAPGLSISAACGGWPETLGAYRLLNNAKVTPAALLAPHQQAVVERCREHACVTVAQDTTEFDYTHMKELTGTGPLNESYRRGFFMHSLFVGTEGGLPLGVLDAATFTRDDETFRAETDPRRPIEEKESMRWVTGYLKTLELARLLPQCEVISVSDREGDIYEVFEAWRQAEEDGPRAEWLIRANQDRALQDVAEGAPNRLFAAMEAAPVMGEITFDIRARKSTKKVKGSTVRTTRAAREVCQTVRAMKVTLRPPDRADRKPGPVTCWAVLAEEANPPEGEEPIRWLLLTSKPVTTLEEARRIINLYLRRWDIEVFHRVLKTGCRVESIQLETIEALLNALMIYVVVAWRILYLTHVGRQCPELPCGCVFGEDEWRATCAVAGRGPAAGEPTLREFIAMVGKLGGHLGRKCDGQPGAQVMWQGLARVRDFALAWRARFGE